MLEGRDDGLERGTARGASAFGLADPEPSPARYPGCLKQLIFSAVTVPESSF